MAGWPVTFIWSENLHPWKRTPLDERTGAAKTRSAFIALSYVVATAATLATDSSVSLKWTSEGRSFLAPLKGGQPFHRALVSKIRAVGLREMAEGPFVHDVGRAVAAMTRRVHRKVANGPFLRDISHAGVASDGIGLALVVQGGGWRSYRSSSRSR